MKRIRVYLKKSKNEIKSKGANFIRIFKIKIEIEEAGKIAHDALTLRKKVRWYLKYLI